MHFPRFRKAPTDRTTISLTNSTLTSQSAIFVEAQTADKALDLVRKLQDGKRQN